MASVWTPATPADVPALRPLYDAYVAELASFGAAYSRDAEGTWQPDHFPYWTERRDFTEALCLRDQGALVGFAFIGHRPFPYMSADCDHRVVEYCVAPGWRGTGLARTAAAALLSERPGQWELSVLIGNPRALAFWRRVTSEPPVQKPEERVNGNELLIRFTVARAPQR